MVQTAPNLTLTLQALAPGGAVLPKELQAALAHSLPIQRAQSCLANLCIWGRLTALNGKDYVIAEGYNRAYMLEGKPVFEKKYFYTQNGVKWVDLGPIPEDVCARCRRVRTALTGDPSSVSAVKEANPDATAAKAPAEGDEAAADGEGGAGAAKDLVFEVSELQRLRSMVNSITMATDLIPKGCQGLTAENHIITNKTFVGLDYPDKLESYIHRWGGPEAPSLAEDIQGTWCLHYDPFKEVATCRNLVWPGYNFYYDNASCTWGQFYHGSGLENLDLVFML